MKHTVLLPLFALIFWGHLPPASAQTDAAWLAVQGPIIEKIDWEDKPIAKAAAELADLVVKKDPQSPWRNLRIGKGHKGVRHLTMQIRDVSAAVAFQYIADAALARLRWRDGMVEFVWPGPTGEENLDEFGMQIKVIKVSPRAVQRLGITRDNIREVLGRHGVRIPGEGTLVHYDEKSSQLALRAVPEECDLAAALVLLSGNKGVEVKPAQP